MDLANMDPRSQGSCVRVVTNTWSRDSHDLFDFESGALQKKEFDVQSDCVSAKWVRRGAEVERVSEETPQSQLSQPADPLLRLTQKGGQWWVDRAEKSGPGMGQNPKKLWLVVKDLNAKGHQLVEGDVIKLGRFRFCVRQLVTSNSPDQQTAMINYGAQTTENTVRVEEKAEGSVCRICLTEGGTEDDPLIVPCNCKGSIECVHLGCLRQWIGGRLDFSGKSGSFVYRHLACELCKGFYPTYVNFGNGKTAPIVEVPKTQPPFIVLENSVSRDTNKSNIHVVSLAEKALKLGRGHESDVRIADVSISRCHSTIRYEDGAFYLEDNKSKFGTLVALRRPRALVSGMPISVQMGRTVLQLHLLPFSGAPLPTRQPGDAESEQDLRLSLLNRCKNEEHEDEDVDQGAGASATQMLQQLAEQQMQQHQQQQRSSGASGLPGLTYVTGVGSAQHDQATL